MWPFKKKDNTEPELPKFRLVMIKNNIDNSIHYRTEQRYYLVHNPNVYYDDPIKGTESDSMIEASRIFWKLCDAGEVITVVKLA